VAKPKLPAEDKRGVLIGVKMTPAEADGFKKQSRSAGYTCAADYLRALIEANDLSLEMKKSKALVEQVARTLAATIAITMADDLANRTMEAVQRKLLGE